MEYADYMTHIVTTFICVWGVPELFVTFRVACQLVVKIKGLGLELDDQGVERIWFGGPWCAYFAHPLTSLTLRREFYDFLARPDDVDL
jgi:hypothetical protein